MHVALCYPKGEEERKGKKAESSASGAHENSITLSRFADVSP